MVKSAICRKIKAEEKKSGKKDAVVVRRARVMFFFVSPSRDANA
jgi:hypothetical protein